MITTMICKVLTRIPYYNTKTRQNDCLVQTVKKR
jgi:hypothetical protein